MTRKNMRESPNLFIRAIRVLTLSLMCFSLAGFCLKADEEYTEWNVRRIAFGLIKAIQYQQKAHYRECRSFSSSFQTLGITIPDGLTGRLLSGRLDNLPAYMVELCAANKCWISDQSGEVLSRENSAVEPDEHPAPAGTDKNADTEKIAGNWAPDSAYTSDNLLPARWVPKRLVASTPKNARQHPKKAAPKARVVPASSPESFGLPPGTELPPLSPRLDSDALWGSIEEVHP